MALIYEQPHFATGANNWESAEFWHLRRIHGFVSNIYASLPDAQLGLNVTSILGSVASIIPNRLLEIETSVTSINNGIQLSLMPAMSLISLDTAAIRADITGNVRPILADIANSFENLVNTLTTELSPVIEAATGAVTSAVGGTLATVQATQAVNIANQAVLQETQYASTDQVVAVVVEGVNTTNTTIGEVQANIGHAMLGQTEMLKAHTTAMSQSLGAAVKGDFEGMGETFASSVYEMNDSFKSFFGDPAAFISKGIDGIRDSIYGASLSALTDIRDVFVPWGSLTADIAKASDEWLLGALEWGKKIILEFVWPIIIEMAKIAIDAIKPAYDILVETFTPIMVDISKFLMLPNEGFFDPFNEMAKAFMGGLMESAEGLFTEGGYPTPDNAVGKAGDAIAFALSRGFTAHAMSNVVKMIPGLHHVQFSNMAALTTQVAGFAPIVNATWGAMMKNALTVPLQYHFNEKFRTRLPDEYTAVDMFLKTDITRDQLNQLYKYHGYSDEWIAALMLGRYTEPRLHDIARMGEDVTLSKEHILKKLQRRGYDKVDTALFADALIQRTQVSDRRALLSEVVRQVSKGFISEDDFDNHLDYLMLRPEHKELIKRQASLKAFRDDTEDLIKIHKDNYQNGIIDKADFQLTLGGLGIQSGKIVVLTAQVEAKRGVSAAREENSAVKAAVRAWQRVSLATWKKWYKFDWINEEEFYNNLVDIGYDPSYADAVVILEETRKYTSIRQSPTWKIAPEIDKIWRKKRRELIEESRSGKITPEQLFDGLVTLGTSIEEAEEEMSITKLPRH